MVTFFRSKNRSLHIILLGAVALSTTAPAHTMAKQQLQGAGERLSHAASVARSAVVGSVRYSTNWINQKIEANTTKFPLWARRQVAGVFRRFATPTAQELQVMRQWMNREPLSEQEQKIWNAYKSRVYSSRGAIAAIVVVVLTILATIAFVVHKKHEREREAFVKDARGRRLRAIAQEGFSAHQIVYRGTTPFRITGTDNNGFVWGYLNNIADENNYTSFDPNELTVQRQFSLGDNVVYDGREWKVRFVDTADNTLDLESEDQVMTGVSPNDVRPYREEQAAIAAPIAPPAAAAGFDPLGVSRGPVRDLRDARIPEEDVAAYEQRAAQARIAAQEKGRRAREARVRRALEVEEPVQFFEEFMSPEAAAREAQEEAERGAIMRQAEQAAAAARAREAEALQEETPEQTIARLQAMPRRTWAEEQMLRHLRAQAEEKRQRTLGPIQVTPIPTEQVGREYSYLRLPQALGQEPPAALLASTIDIVDEVNKLERNQKMQEASARSAQRYKDAMQAWGRRWDSISPKPEHQQEVYNVARWLLERESEHAIHQIISNLRKLNDADREFLGRFIAGTPLESKLKRITQGIQREQQARQRVAMGQQQRARVMRSASLEPVMPQPDRNVMSRLVDSLIGGAGAGAGASAAAAAEEPTVSFITQWGSLKAGIDRYLRTARRNITQNQATPTEGLIDRLNTFRRGALPAQLNSGALARIRQDLEGYIGAGKELQSFIVDIMRAGAHEEITPQAARVIVDRNFLAIPQLFKDAPYNLTPETVYTFLGIPQATRVGDMREAILRKIKELRRARVANEDLSWLQRQLMYYTNQYEKDRLDAALGNEDALARLRAREAVQLEEQVKRQYEDDLAALITELRTLQPALPSGA